MAVSHVDVRQAGTCVSVVGKNLRHRHPVDAIPADGPKFSKSGRALGPEAEAPYGQIYDFPAQAHADFDLTPAETATRP